MPAPDLRAPGELRRQREARCLSQSQLGALVRPPLTIAALSRIERGVHRPTEATLARLREALAKSPVRNEAA